MRVSPPFELETSFKKHFVALDELNSQKAKIVSITVAPRLSYQKRAEWALDLLNEIFRMVPKFRGFETKMHSGSHGPYSLD